MKHTNLKEKIISLRAEGFTLNQIQERLHCSHNSVVYHLYPKAREASKERGKRALENGSVSTQNKKYRTTARGCFATKLVKFNSPSSSIHDTKKLTLEEAWPKVESTSLCYLTGDVIDLSKSNSYSLDHKIPASRGGENGLSNLGLCTAEVNKAKNDKTPEEFFELCKKVLIHNGYTITKL